MSRTLAAFVRPPIPSVPSVPSVREEIAIESESGSARSAGPGPGAGRYAVPVDVHVILRREGPAGPEVLLTRRAGPVYASGMWHLPSGHLDGPHEDVVRAAIREAREETGVRLARAGLRAAVTVHHRAPKGSARIGVFFEAEAWQGRPEITEPDRCDGMGWFGPDRWPEPMVAYCRAGLTAWLAGDTFAVHFQHPGERVDQGPPG
ncbi:NUDIX hydrolase (plasmid) [Streptomyces sp. BI20]|uniref:NUDIX hydrolase n=1 Tax=Streptomyces sp. BI20 TaxID=3403460 RepID=UPI003C7582C7